MTLSAVQARVSEVEAQLRALQPVPPRPATPAAPSAAASSGAGGSTAATSFATALSQAMGAPAATSAAGAAGVTPVGQPGDGAGGTTGEEVVAYAKRFLGVPYVWGGASPSGFDCSGLVQYVYEQFGIDLPRVSRDQARAGREVSAADARPGDLIAQDVSGSRPGVDHIGIYAGDGKWVVAPRSGETVSVRSIDLSSAVTIRRVLPDAPAGASPTPAALAAPAAAGTGAVAPASVAWTQALPSAAQPWVGALQQAASSQGVDPRLLAALVWSESGFSAAAVSRAGAIGLSQLMPATARGLGVDPWDPAANLLGGARYLAEQLRRFGTAELALAAYNAGPGAVSRAGGVPPYAETQRYVRTVLDRYAALGGTR